MQIWYDHHHEEEGLWFLGLCNEEGYADDTGLHFYKTTPQSL